MKTSKAPEVQSLTYFTIALFLLITSVARGDVAVTAGNIISTGTIGLGNSLHIQGTNFSLDAVPLSLSSLQVTANEEAVTFVPANTISLAGPGNILYNGINTSLFTVQMNFTAAPVSVPNVPGATGGPNGAYSGSVSNVAFSMTGTLTIYSDFIGGTVSQTVPISGMGIYSARAVGDFAAGGPGALPNGQATYQFTGPSGFALDTTTQGAWNVNYGGDGFQIVNGTSQIPSYAALSFPGASTYTWAGQTSDVRALQNGAGSNNRIAAAYVGNYGSSFSINVNMVDGKLHRVAIYLLDWDLSSRVETITITDAATNTVLDSETFSGFENGEYAAWNLRGNVNLRVTSVSGGNAVVNGIFFGPSGTPPLTATSLTGAMARFEGLNALTSGFAIHGFWPQAYGTAGYLIAGGASAAPLYGQVSVTGALNYTWAGQTSDSRALETSANSNTFTAAAYTQYAGTSFSIHVNVTDRVAHPVSLYLLDWDSTTRQETITIRDASTNAILSSVTFSGFHDGQYATWDIAGNVLMTITPVGPVSPAVSGIFFN